jgi:hypothetical protein
MKRKATMFIRLEWGTEIDGKVYICETGYDNVLESHHGLGAIVLGGVPAPHHEARRATQGTSFTDKATGYRDYTW